MNNHRYRLLAALAVFLYSSSALSSDGQRERQLKVKDLFIAHFECSYYAGIADAGEYLKEEEVAEWEDLNLRHFREGVKLARQYYDDGLSNYHHIPEGKDVSADFFAGKEYQQWTWFARDEIRKRHCPDIISDCLWTVLTMSEYHDSNCKLLPME